VEKCGVIGESFVNCVVQTAGESGIDHLALWSARCFSLVVAKFKSFIRRPLYELRMRVRLWQKMACKFSCSIQLLVVEKCGVIGESFVNCVVQTAGESGIVTPTGHQTQDHLALWSALCCSYERPAHGSKNQNKSGNDGNGYHTREAYDPRIPETLPSPLSFFHASYVLSLCVSHRERFELSCLMCISANTRFFLCNIVNVKWCWMDGTITLFPSNDACTTGSGWCSGKSF
jgi:hypothetical protein